MNKKLRDTVVKAEQKLNEANCAIQAIAGYKQHILGRYVSIVD